VTDRQSDLLELCERTALLLGCLRNYRRSGQQVDLEGAYRLEPEVMALLTPFRDMLRGLACEHGAADGEWCPLCNREYKAARAAEGGDR